MWALHGEKSDEAEKAVAGSSDVDILIGTSKTLEEQPDLAERLTQIVKDILHRSHMAHGLAATTASKGVYGSPGSPSGAQRAHGFPWAPVPWARGPLPGLWSASEGNGTSRPQR